MMNPPQVMTPRQETAAVELANEVSNTVRQWQKRFPDMPDDLAASILQMITDYGPMTVGGFVLKAPAGPIN